MSGPVVLPPPAPGVDGRVALAMGLQAAPGCYAVLLGSGMSRAAGIPTAWEVVRDLIRRVAAAEDVDLGEDGDTPERWWEEQGRGEPRYDDLVGALAPTEAARQRLLADYFKPKAGASGEVGTSDTHAALARLVASGRVRLILTTNLDRLTERALDHAGVAAEVISSPEQLRAMTPLTHARATVVKLHGDYAMLGSRNTPEELADYPAGWKALLARAFEEYGLVVIGWSAEYDTSLVGLLSTAPRHAFPAFWVSYQGEFTETARRVIALRHAAVIDSTGAEEFLRDLNDRIDRLDRAATRRGRPKRLSAYNQQIQDSGSPEPGWSVNPLLRIRVVAFAGPVDDSSGIGPEQREALVTALRQSPATQRLRAVAGPAAHANPQAPGEPEAAPLLDWHPTPVPFQSSSLASYRLGGDGIAGTTALAGINFPTITRTNAALLSIDFGVSIKRQLQLFEIAQILRDCLVLTTGPMFDAIEDVVASDAAPWQAQLYVLVSTHVSNGVPERENDLSQRVDLRPLGETHRPPGKMLSYAAAISGALVERDAAELVLDAIRQTALDAGYLDPRLGLRLLRHQMGLPVSAS